ncbi:MAG: DUF2218 domain-containing protein [Rhodoplanes sp.]|uniref:DUF2218 domain-containing protein n=1 Tax=Rhodoplanes sp. TaxID=1968906 RepID=UPI00179508E4|nr:DUF2218 domain-containing protein [Rhodoplanes sp.]NVO14867.1 DUF2218 domain-containing protein [Rhodoplanes sp.]
MTRSTARLATDRASTYLQQLCKHFAHKLPVEVTPEAGRITFTIGVCRLAASDGLLTLRVEAEDAARLAELQDVVARHLLRFAFRDPPAIEWRTGDEE